MTSGIIGKNSMLWVILFIVVVLVSLLLAFRSMKDYQEIPQEAKDLTFALYLISQKNLIDEEVLKKIYQFSLKLNSIISFEFLKRGADSALVVYAPTEFLTQFSSLAPVELEDYLENSGKNSNPTKLSVNNSIAWVITAKNNPKKSLVMTEDFFKLELGEDQGFYLQAVCLGNPKQSDTFQVTVRAIVFDKNPNNRVTLAKTITEKIQNNTSLLSTRREEPTLQVFQDYQKRTLIPKEVNEFSLTVEEIKAIIGVK